METDDFYAAIGKLIDLSHATKTAVMCAEAVPWRCHRSLIGDALVVRGEEVCDIVSLRSCRPHKLTPYRQGRRREDHLPGCRGVAVTLLDAFGSCRRWQYFDSLG